MWRNKETTRSQSLFTQAGRDITLDAAAPADVSKSNVHSPVSSALGLHHLLRENRSSVVFTRESLAPEAAAAAREVKRVIAGSTCLSVLERGAPCPGCGTWNPSPPCHHCARRTATYKALCLPTQKCTPRACIFINASLKKTSASPRRTLQRPVGLRRPFPFSRNRQRRLGSATTAARSLTVTRWAQRCSQLLGRTAKRMKVRGGRLRCSRGNLSTVNETGKSLYPFHVLPQKN